MAYHEGEDCHEQKVIGVILMNVLEQSDKKFRKLLV